MTITGVSGGMGSGSNAYQVSQLQKQIQRVQAQISEIQADTELDDETKSQQLSLYQTQLAQAQQTTAAPAQASSSPSLADMVQDSQEESKAPAPFGAGQYLDKEI